MATITLTIEAPSGYDLHRLAGRIEDFVEFNSTVMVTESTVED